MIKQERVKLIARVAKASGIAKYAIEKKITDEDLLKLSEHLDILKLVKSSNDYNRYCQAQKTAEANAKLKQFLNPDNSEVIKIGKWLFETLSKKGEERKNHLLENNLVHKEDYNGAITDLKEVIKEQQNGLIQTTEKAEEIIKDFEIKNDKLRKQLDSIQLYITNNYGMNTWNEIRKYWEK
ncbi:hypothetical protein [Geminocystis herdmanii]|uniref:hypothetical protein n=1 Tax=Geminocystis herdmanii TaxID=669359 RepID=UPI0003469F4A|nr:hypothetical protein [Geminocystis herdmanii]